MTLLFRISVQLSLESLIAHASATPSTLEQLQVYFYLITRRIQFDCLDRSIYSKCTLCN